MGPERAPEVLGPAGGPAAFRAALAGGADAIYCGLGNDFNARRGADNFSDEEFRDCCAMAHVLGARVYVTVNVVIQDDEMPRALASVARAVRLGADALIVQDWGLAWEVARRWPEAEVHVSTQANVHDPRGVLWCAAQGFERVTLSRELSIPEIADCCATGVECEVFGHGAICFCYSGLCQMSSLRGPRSANRGLCAQPCRLPHTLEDAQGRRVGPAAWERGLCPKDALSLDHVAELMDAGVGSLKIEGRMKAPEYVLSTVSSYREAVDALAEGRGDPDPDGVVHRRLKRAFNRDFTDAYLVGASGNEMMSYERSNNRGETVGAVRACDRREAVVDLVAPVGKGDLVEFRPLEDPDAFFTVLSPQDAAPGRFVCPVKRPVPAGTPVRVLRSQEALDAAAEAVGRTWPRRRPVRVSVRCRLGEELVVAMEALDRDGSVAAAAEATGPVVEAARTRALEAGDVRAHVGRMGETPFDPVSIDVDLETGCGMGFSVLHRVRAEAAQALADALNGPYEERALSAAAPPSWELWGEEVKEERALCSLPDPAPVPKNARDRDAALAAAAEAAEVCCLAPTPEVARAALAAGADRVYATVDALSEGGFPDGCVPVLDEVCRESDHERNDRWVEEGRPCAVGNVSELALAAERGAAPEVRGCVPVHNRSAVLALERAGAAGLWLSPELTVAQAVAVCRAASVPVGAQVFGAMRAMTSEHCVLQMADACIHDCARCALRRQELYLRNIDDRRLPVRTDANGRSRIWWDEPLDAVPKLREVLGAGVGRLLVDATLLDAEGAAAQVARVREALDAVVLGGRLPGPWPRSTLGHLFSKVD